MVHFLHPDSRGSRLLKSIIEEQSDFMFGMSRPSLVYRYGKEEARRIVDRKGRAPYRRTMLDLQRKGYISTNDRGEIDILESGYMEYLLAKARTAELLEGCFLIIVFDIPESRRQIRNRLKTIMRQLGCGALQRSVWITPFDIRDNLLFIAKKIGVEGCVKVYRVIDEQ